MDITRPTVDETTSSAPGARPRAGVTPTLGSDPPSIPVRRVGRRVGVIALIAVAFAGGLLAHRIAPDLHATKHGTNLATAAKQLWTCSMHPQVIREAPGVCPICHMMLTPLRGDISSQHSEGMSIDPVVVQNMGVRFAEVARGPLHRDLRAVGYLAEAQPNQVDISPRVSGWIEKLYADTEGMHVTQGEPLFDLYSPRLQVAVEELVSSRRARDAVKSAADGMTARAADDLLETARIKLLQWGLTAGQIDTLAKSDHAPRAVTFLSPATGHVTEKAIVEGSSVKEGDRVLRIVSHKSLWLDLQVYEQQLPFVRIGQHVEATVEAFPGRSFTGELFFIHPHVDVISRAAMARVVLPNESLDLRPGMFATAMIHAELAADAVIVPREAVIDSGTRQIAFIARDAGHFEPRTLRLGPAGTDGMTEVVQVLEGLVPGERVVTSGQFLLDAESRLREAIQKQTGENLLAGAKPSAARSSPTSMPADMAVAATQPVRSQPQIDEMVLQYLQLTRLLGADQPPAHPLDPGPLATAAETLRAQMKGSADEPLATDIVQTAKALAGEQIDEQRRRLKSLSTAVIRVVEIDPPSKAVGDALLVMNCPMKKADWLQTTAKVANPYYATSMKECGSVARTIPLK